MVSKVDSEELGDEGSLHYFPAVLPNLILPSQGLRMRGIGVMGQQQG